VIDARSIDRAIDAFHESSRRVYAQHVNRVSQAGIACKRRLLWHRTNWKEQKLPDVKLQRFFALGNTWEPLIVEWLEGAGIKVLQRQRDLSWPKLQLTGHVDGIIELPGTGEKALFEGKSCSPFVFEKICRCESAADLVRVGKDYLTGYVTQTGLYLLLLPMEYGLLIFVNKSTGETHSILISLMDPVVLELAEAHLKRLEVVNAAVAKSEDLPAEPNDDCPRCPFFAACAPVLSFPMLSVLEDEELAEAVATRQATAAAAKAHDKADSFIKSRVTQPGEYLIGDWILRAKSHETTVYDVPTDVKLGYAKKISQLRRTYLPAAATTAAPKSEEAA
jgi:CRISPR/Cas system-associated exonuclease Cas4 (RecB family)